MTLVCKACNKRTTWDYSIGRPCYLICNDCAIEMVKRDKKPLFEITIEILNKGFELEKKYNQRGKQI